MKYTTKDREDAIKELRRIGIRPGATVYTIVTHVARSGMSRHIHCYIVRRGEVQCISGLVATAINESRDGRSGALKVSGCGMDMCWHTVYRLGRAMFPKGGSLQHSPRRAQEERAGRTIEVDGGYLLRNRSL